jgi:hypothetical protein
MSGLQPESLHSRASRAWNEAHIAPTKTHRLEAAPVKPQKILLRDLLAMPDLISGANMKWLRKNRRLNFTARKGIAVPEKLSLARDLEAKFVKYWSNSRGHGWRRITGRNVMSKADGIEFLCPLCFRNNGGDIGTHVVVCWFSHIPQQDPETGKDISPTPGRWNPGGTGLEDISFIPPGSTSVALRGGCNWHGFIENGHAKPA